MTNRPRDEGDALEKGGAKAEELKQHARAVKEDLLDLGRATKDVASEKLGDAKHIAVEYYGESKQAITHVEDRVERYIRQKPLQTVAMAAAAGVLLGFLLKRR